MVKNNILSVVNEFYWPIFKHIYLYKLIVTQSIIYEISKMEQERNIKTKQTISRSGHDPVTSSEVYLEGKQKAQKGN